MAIVMMVMKLMFVLDIGLWLLMLPLITPAACAVLISLEEDEKT